MPAPSVRYKILPARGDKAALVSAIAAIDEGEICYARDEDRFYVKEGGVLVLTSIEEAPQDGTQYVRNNGAWEAVDVPPGTIVGTSADLPGTIETGQLWYDTESGRTFVWTATEWADASPDGGYATVVTSDNPPATASDGDLWYRSSDGRMYVYYDDGASAQWVDTNPNLPVGSDTWQRTGTNVTLANIGDKVGIGTISPTSNLEVVEDGTHSIVTASSNISTTALASRFSLGNSVGNSRFTINMKGGGGEEAYLGSEGNFPIYFQTHGAERVRIDSSGVIKHTGITGAGGANKLARYVVPSHNTNEEDVMVFQVENESSFNQITFGGGASSYNCATQILFKTASAVDTTVGSEAMRIDSSGRLLVGTNADISGNNVATLIQTVSSNGAVIAVGRNDTSVDGNNRIGGLRFFANDPVSTTYNDVAYIVCEAAGTHAADDYPTRLEFHTTAAGNPSPAERMRIHDAGAVSVGDQHTVITNSTDFQVSKTSGSQVAYFNSESLGDDEASAVWARGEVSGTSRLAAIQVRKHSGITNGVGVLFLDQEDGGNSYFWTDNSNNLRMSTNASHTGTTSGTVVGTQTSDERLKNVGSAVSYGLAEVKQLQPKQYALKSDPDVNKLGFIAQEVESIIPEAVFDTNEELDGHKDGDRTRLGMEYVQLIPVLVNAIKELSAKNDVLEQRLTDAGL